MRAGRNLGKEIGKLVVIPVLSALLAQTIVFANAGGTASTVPSSATLLPQKITSSSEGSSAPDSSVPVVVNSDADAGKVKITQEQAIAKLRELFPALKEAEVERVELGDQKSQYPPPENQLVWQIQWQYRKGNSTHGFSSSVDAVTGDVLNIYLYGPMLDESEVYYPPKVTRDSAFKIAADFIRKAAPSLPAGQLVENKNTYLANEPLFGPVRYHFSLYPKVNGIPSPNTQINITIDGNGNVVQFYWPGNVAGYPEPVPRISLEEAKRKYRENLKLTLQYIPVGNEAEREWFLGWVPDQASSFKIIDAVSGEFLNYDGKPVKAESAGYEELPVTEKVFKPAKPAGGQFLTAEEAAKAVEQVIQIPEEKKLSSKMLQDDFSDRNRKVWRLIWSSAEEVPFGPVPDESFAVVDARTGQILEYREERFPRPVPTDNHGEQQGKIALEDARKRAITLVQQLYPNAREELKWVKQDLDLPVSPSGDVYTLHFQRFYQNRPVEGDGVFLTLDSSGNIQYYSASVTPDLDKKLKGLEPKVSEEEALAKYLANTDLQLQYSRFGGYYANSGYEKPFVKLVYQEVFKNGMNLGLAIDAADGRWRSRWQPDFQGEAVVQPVDIENHWAKEELKTMVQYGILQPDSAGRLEPDRPITRGEWLQMMAKAVEPYYQQVYYSDDEKPSFKGVGPESPYYKAVIVAVRHQWVDADKESLGLDLPLTREDLAVSLAHILGYDKLAKILADDKDLLSGFRDAGQIKEKGSVYLAHRLGLLTATSGTFNPKGKVSRAEAAVVMMRLVRLQGKTDNEISY